MTSDIQNYNNYSQLDANSSSPSEKYKSQRWNVVFLILSFILGAETLITGFLLYEFSEKINKTLELANYGEYPLDCLYQLADPDYQPINPVDLTSCDLLIQELKNGAHKRLLLDIQNAVLEALGESNITQSYKPVIHVGAEQELRQYQPSLREGGIKEAPDRLRWDNINGQVVQEGLMRLSPEGEITVPLDGLYFVYSQVYFQRFPASARLKQDMQYTQYIYQRTASYPEPVLLAKATVTPCLDAASDAQLFSSHQGALFRLQKGDRLSLHVRDISAVRLPQDSTYFGAFMIS